MVYSSTISDIEFRVAIGIAQYEAQVIFGRKGNKLNLPKSMLVAKKFRFEARELLAKLLGLPKI